MRELVPCTVLEMARASWVLPVPGKSSSSRWPSESMQVRASRMTCSLPSTALSQFATMAENVWANQADWSWVTVMRGVLPGATSSGWVGPSWSAGTGRPTTWPPTGPASGAGGGGWSPSDITGPVAGAATAQPHVERTVTVGDDDAGAAPVARVAGLTGGAAAVGAREELHARRVDLGAVGLEDPDGPATAAAGEVAHVEVDPGAGLHGAGAAAVRRPVSGA